MEKISSLISAPSLAELLQKDEVVLIDARTGPGAKEKYLQEHLVTGTITPGPNGTAEVDAPISDFTGLTAGSTLLRPSAATYVREGVNQGPLEPADSAGPTYDDVLGACTS